MEVEADPIGTQFSTGPSILDTREPANLHPDRGMGQSKSFREVVMWRNSSPIGGPRPIATPDTPSYDPK